MNEKVSKVVEAGIAAVRQEEEHLKQTARDLEEELQALDSEQRRIERVAGDDLLDARFSGDTKAEKKVAQSLENIRLKRTMLEKQLAACRVRIDNKHLERWKTEARACQEAAVKHREEAAAHWVHTEDLLRQINEYELCDYVLKRPEAKMGEPARLGITASLNWDAYELEKHATEALDMARIFERKINPKRGEEAQTIEQAIDPEEGELPPGVEIE